MSYIVKNCPCLFNSYYASGKTVRFECNDGNHDDKLCRDVTDCVLKQIVELCKENLNSLETYIDVRSFECVTLQNILQLLDIQEVELTCNIFLVIVFGMYKALSILGFIYIYLVCNNHPCWGILLLFIGTSGSLKIEA